MTKPNLWGVLWHHKNKLDGLREYLDYDNCLPVLFRTRREAREWIAKKYGYIETRLELRAEPFGWRMPRPVKVTVEVSHDR